MIPNDPTSLPDSVETMSDIIGNEGFLLDNPLWTTLKVVFSVLVFFTIFFLVLFLYRWLRQFLKKRKILPPDQKALKVLQDMNASQEDQDYYTNLTEILRHYISDHLKLNIRDKTSEEILFQKALPRDGDVDPQKWEEFWRRSQSVVFGHLPVEQTQRAEDYHLVKNFIKNTRRVSEKL